MLHPGEQLGGFVVEGLLGEGAESGVFRLRSQSDGTAVALKLATSDTPAAEVRFRREAALHARVQHPNVLRLLQTIPLGDRTGLLLELVEGPALSSLLRRGPIPVERIAPVGDALIAAVAAVHAAGILHRDIKPSNVLMRPDGEGGWTPKLCDFGLARAVEDEELPDAESIYGTPTYMAPETIRGTRTADQRADIFALGALLYELVCTRPAFRADSEQLFRDIAEGRFERPARLATVPAHQEIAIVGALQPELRWRVPDAGTLLALWRGESPLSPYSLPPGALGSRSGPARVYRHSDPTLVADADSDSSLGPGPARVPDGEPSADAAETGPAAEAVAEPAPSPEPTLAPKPAPRPDRPVRVAPPPPAPVSFFRSFLEIVLSALLGILLGAGWWYYRSHLGTPAPRPAAAAVVPAPARPGAPPASESAGATPTPPAEAEKPTPVDPPKAAAPGVAPSKPTSPAATRPVPPRSASPKPGPPRADPAPAGPSAAPPSGPDAPPVQEWELKDPFPR